MTDIQMLFYKLNRQYFDGKLPEYHIVTREDLGAGCGGCDKAKREIRLSAMLAEDELTKVLLHEMAHAAVSENGHNTAWLAEMERLANMGAPTREDWEAYQDPLKTITEKDMESEAYDMGAEWDISWAEARTHIGSKYGLTDAHGRAKSKATAKLMQKLRKQFYKGRRECAF